MLRTKKIIIASITSFIVGVSGYHIYKHKDLLGRKIRHLCEIKSPSKEHNIKSGLTLEEAEELEKIMNGDSFIEEFGLGQGIPDINDNLVMESVFDKTVDNDDSILGDETRIVNKGNGIIEEITVSRAEEVKDIMDGLDEENVNINTEEDIYWVGGQKPSLDELKEEDWEQLRDRYINKK